MANNYDIMFENEYNLMDVSSEFDYDQYLNTADFFLGFNAPKVKDKKESDKRKLLTDALVGGSLLAGTGAGLAGAVLTSRAAKNPKIDDAMQSLNSTNSMMGLLLGVHDFLKHLNDQIDSK